ncbi:MAG TPA: acyl-CoA reductase, partial [Verrucomicrobiae bacterium]|nr:acyl-CoA reductase [Verrucomicrobiae bacterium]
RRVPAGKKLVTHGHRVSFAYVAAEVLAGLAAARVVGRAAVDVVAWNQLGCLSPHVIYVQNGAPVSPERFAEMLADELERLEQTEPRGPLSVEDAAAVASRRSLYEVRAAHVPETRHWSSKGSTAWTVVCEADPLFQVSCLNRFIYVKGVENLDQAMQAAEAVRGRVSTVAVAAPEHQVEQMALNLARWGASRICQIGKMQNPPLTWRHDGRPVLGDLITWTDLEY